MPDGNAVLLEKTGGMPQDTAKTGSGCFSYELTATNLSADSVPAVFTHDGKTGFFHHGLHRMRDVAQAVAENRRMDRCLQRFSSGAHELGCFG